MSVVENSFEKVRSKLTASRIEFLSQLAKFSKEELVQQPIEEEWSPLRLAHHIYITDGLYLEEMKRIQDEENPLTVNVKELGPELTSASELPTSLDAVLAGMAARREEILEYLSHLPEEAWLRPCRHEEWGDLKFYQLVNVVAMHDLQHAQQLAAFKAAMK